MEGRVLFQRHCANSYPSASYLIDCASYPLRKQRQVRQRIKNKLNNPEFSTFADDLIEFYKA